jgi:uncharacterized protein
MSPALCPICKKEPPSEDHKVAPFCSQRCKEIDLGKWLAGDYRIPERTTPADLPEDLDEDSEAS